MKIFFFKLNCVKYFIEKLITKIHISKKNLIYQRILSWVGIELKNHNNSMTGFFKTPHIWSQNQ